MAISKVAVKKKKQFLCLSVTISKHTDEEAGRLKRIFSGSFVLCDLIFSTQASFMSEIGLVDAEPRRPEENNKGVT